MTIANNKLWYKMIISAYSSSLDWVVVMGIHIKSDKLLHKRLKMSYSGNRLVILSYWVATLVTYFINSSYYRQFQSKQPYQDRETNKLITWGYKYLDTCIWR